MDKRRSIIAALLGGKSQNTVCRDLGCSKTTVSKAVKVIRDYAIDSEAIEHLTDADLDEMFSVRSSDMEPRESPYADPDFEEVCARLERNPKLTLLYLWEEYASKCQGDKRPLSYSQYCRRFGKWQRSPQTASIMRYVAGQTAFVDWAGLTGEICSKATGRKHTVYLFVFSLPYSSLIFAKGYLSLSQSCWIDAHISAFEYIGGVPRIVVPDHCATATVNNTGEPYRTVVNETYSELADHYGFSTLPARVGRPRDKNVVEAGVNLCERWVIAPIAEEMVFSIEEYNARVLERIEWLNDRPFQQREGSRRSVFTASELPELSPLPPTRFEIPTWKRAKVAPNGHVQIDYMHYSVPWKHVGETVDVKATFNDIRIYSGGVQIAEHKRLTGAKNQYSTVEGHMASSWPDAKSPWDKNRFTSWASRYGKAALVLIPAKTFYRWPKPTGPRPFPQPVRDSRPARSRRRATRRSSAFAQR